MQKAANKKKRRRQFPLAAFCFLPSAFCLLPS